MGGRSKNRNQAALKRILRSSNFYRSIALAPFVLWGISTGTSIAFRPPTAPVELETLASAWHMFLANSWIPIRNGVEAPHLPPLQLWLILLGWKIWGPVLWWPRLLSVCASFLALLAVGPLAKMLWPKWPLAPHFARLLLAGTVGFVLASTLISPEIISLPILSFMLGALFHIWRNRNRQTLGAWVIFSLCAMLLSLVVGWYLALSLCLAGAIAPFFGAKTKAPMSVGRWHISLGLSSGIGLLLPFLFLPSVDIFSYGNFWLDRGTEATRSEPWTLLLFPVMLYPWVSWQTLWRALNSHLHRKWGASFGFGLMVTSVFAIACIAAGTQLQGLLPVTLPLSLIGARLLSRVRVKAKDFHAAVPGLLALSLSLVFFLFNIIPTAHLDAVWRQFFGIELPIWLGGISLISGLVLLGLGIVLSQLSPQNQLIRTLQVACLPIAIIVALNAEFRANLDDFFDLSPVGVRLSQLQQAGNPIAVYGLYRGEFDYFGRLQLSPIPLPTKQAAIRWAAEHPDGAILSYFHGSPFRLPQQPYYRGVARDRWVAIWPARTVIDTNGEVLRDRF